MLTFTGGEGLSERMNALNFLPIIEAEVIRGIRVNTSQGLDAGGSSFAGYTNAYKEYGRLRKGLSTNPVNLRVKTSDSLLDTLGAEKVSENESVISVKADRELIADGLSAKRQFMGVTSGAILRIEQKLEDELKRVMS